MEMWVICALGSLLLPMFGWFIWQWNEIWYVGPVKARCSSYGAKMPPGHMGLPFLGEVLTFLWYFKILRRPDDFITSKRRKYGDNVGLHRTYLFGCPSVIACSPSVCKLVLNSSDFIQNWPTAEALGSNSIMTLHGPRHDTIKTFIVNAINHPDALARIVLQVQPSIVDALESWSQMPKMNSFDEVKKVALEYTGRCFAGLEGVAVHEKAFWAILQGFRAQPWNIPGTAYHQAVKCRRKIAKILEEEIERRRQNNNKATLGTTNDLMTGLMEMSQVEGRHLTDEEVVDNVLTTVHISHIAVTFTVPWALYYLAKFPHVLQKLREENKILVEKKNGAHITYNDILKLKYTTKVVEETIRMGNVTPFVFREAIEDVEYKGYIIPKGWKVMAMLRYLHTDPENFEDPMTFNPERWNERPKLGTYLPFGGGARYCPGNMFARVNLALFLHHLAVGYKWELLNPDVTITYLSHPRPSDGLEITLRKL